jgi:tetratricopeptide (TPR) repeat protein
MTGECYEQNWKRCADLLQENCSKTNIPADAELWVKARAQFESRYPPPASHSITSYYLPSSGSTGSTAPTSTSAADTALPTPVLMPTAVDGGGAPSGATDTLDSTSGTEYATLTVEQIAEADQEKDLGNAAIREKQFAKAVMHYSSALALRPNHAIYLANRAVARMYLTEYEAAERDCEAAVAADPSYAKAYSHLGYADMSDHTHTYTHTHTHTHMRAHTYAHHFSPV